MFRYLKVTLYEVSNNTTCWMRGVREATLPKFEVGGVIRKKNSFPSQ